MAETYPNDPIALDALVQVVVQELWLMGNTTYPGGGKDIPSIGRRTIASTEAAVAGVFQMKINYFRRPVMWVVSQQGGPSVL